MLPIPTFDLSSMHHTWISTHDALMKWELLPRDHFKNIILCKWLYKIKQNADGWLDHYEVMSRRKVLPETTSQITDLLIVIILTLTPHSIRNPNQLLFI